VTSSSPRRRLSGIAHEPHDLAGYDASDFVADARPEFSCRDFFYQQSNSDFFYQQSNDATNTNRRPLMSESYTLPTKPEGIVATLRERFNSGKVSAMMGLYAPEAVFIAKDGRTITDHTEIAAELERDLKLGLPLEAKARHVFVAGDIAQIVLDWSIDGTGPDGKHVHLGGSASDILRRGADGLWRYIIDNNQGTAVRQPA
jgi:ketosteroid isomerase-like protein